MAYKPYCQVIHYHHLYPLGYLFLSTLVGITYFNAQLLCIMDGICHDPHLVWVTCRFCRWICLLAFELFHMLYFPINLLFCPWPGSFYTTAKCAHPALVMCTSFCSHISVYGIWPLFPAFPGPSCRPNAVCPPAILHICCVPCGNALLLVVQTGVLTLAFTQTSSSMG